MNISFRILILTLAILAVAAPVRATYEEQIAERKDLQERISDMKGAVAKAQRAQIRYLDKGDVNMVDGLEASIKQGNKIISQLEKKLKGVQAKIVKSENERMKERMQETARVIAQKASRDAAMAASQEAAKNAARDLARNASKDAGKTASKDSNKSSSQDAAKSAVHPPAPVCKPSPGH